MAAWLPLVLGCDSGPKQLGRGDRLPELQLSDLRGNPSPLKPGDGRPMIINFWASWCEPCRREMPTIECLHRLGAREVAVIGVTFDADLNLAREFLAAHALSFPNLSDVKGLASEAALGVRYLPETFVVAPDGKILDRVLGAKDWSDAKRLAAYGIKLDESKRASEPACNPQRSA